MMNNTPNNTSKSPCIRNCCLDNNDICLGCFRAIDEIVGWQNKPETERLKILEKCAKRQEQATKL